MAQTFRRENNRIAIKLLLEIFAGMLFHGLAAIAEFGAVIRAPRVRWQIATAVRTTNFEAWVAIQGPLENQVSEGDGRLQRIAHHVGEESVALKPLQTFHESRWVQTQQTPQLLGFCPHRIEFGIRQLLAVHAAGNFKPTESQLLYAMLHLLDGEIGVLQSQSTKTYEPVRMSGAQCSDLINLAGDDLAGKIAVGPVVVGGSKAHGLDIDSVLVHMAKTCVHIFCGAKKRAIERGRATVWD